MLLMVKDRVSESVLISRYRLIDVEEGELSIKIRPWPLDWTWLVRRKLSLLVSQVTELSRVFASLGLSSWNDIQPKTKDKISQMMLKFKW